MGVFPFLCLFSSAEDAQAVYSMSLVCTAGSITWFGAEGGVRLELTPFTHSQFRACFMAESINTHLKISREVAHQSSSSSPVSSSPKSSQSSPSSSSLSYSPRLSYKLRRLHADEDNSFSGVSEFWLEPLLTASGKSKEFCQDVGPGRPLMLFLETAATPSVHGVPKVKFHYDVRKLSTETPQDPMDGESTEGDKCMLFYSGYISKWEVLPSSLVFSDLF